MRREVSLSDAVRLAHRLPRSRLAMRAPLPTAATADCSRRRPESTWHAGVEVTG